MASLRQSDDTISLSVVDIRLMLAMRTENLNAYQLARQAEKDAPELGKISNGTLQPALRSLEALTLVEKRKNGSYVQTRLGREVRIKYQKAWARLGSLT